MAQTDENETVVPEKRTRLQRMDRSEMALSATGFGLAAFAAFFPWYVFFHHEDFAIRHDGMEQNLKRDLPAGPPRSVFSVSPSASININQAQPGMAAALPKGFDDIKTGAIPDEEKGKPAEGNDPGAVNQPLPGGGKSFRLLHVSGGRALIEDSGGMYIVGVGSALPDNSHLAKIEQRGANWVIVTSNGDVVTMN